MTQLTSVLCFCQLEKAGEKYTEEYLDYKCRLLPCFGITTIIGVLWISVLRVLVNIKPLKLVRVHVDALRTESRPPQKENVIFPKHSQ